MNMYKGSQYVTNNYKKRRQRNYCHFSRYAWSTKKTAIQSIY